MHQVHCKEGVNKTCLFKVKLGENLLKIRNIAVKDILGASGQEKPIFTKKFFRKDCFYCILAVILDLWITFLVIKEDIFFFKSK